MSLARQSRIPVGHMEGTNGARLDELASTPMRPHNNSEINVLERGQAVQPMSGNPSKLQKFVTENHGVGSSILPLGTTNVQSQQTLPSAVAATTRDAFFEKSHGSHSTTWARRDALTRISARSLSGRASSARREIARPEQSSAAGLDFVDSRANWWPTSVSTLRQKKLYHFADTRNLA
jgi:hypothetical protein